MTRLASFSSLALAAMLGPAWADVAPENVKARSAPQRGATRAGKAARERIEVPGGPRHVVGPRGGVDTRCLPRA